MDGHAPPDTHAIPMPEIDAGRCVHALSPIASCRACCDACPHAAFALGDDGLTLNTESCDGCGICIAACSEGAIALARPPSPLVPAGPDQTRAFAACDRVANRGEAGLVPCIDAIGVTELAHLHARGIRVLAIAHGDCATCPRQRAPGLTGHAATIAKLTDDRGLERLELRAYGIAAWRDARDGAGRLTRRGLFRRMLHTVETTVAAATETARPAAAGEILPRSEAAHLAATAPVIDPGRCTACGVCVNVCPHGVISRAGQDGDAPRYEVAALRCTGCGLCADACTDRAIVIDRWCSLPRPPLRLVAGQCAACGNPYLWPEQRPLAKTARCPICAAKASPQKLFQVLP